MSRRPEGSVLLINEAHSDRETHYMFDIHLLFSVTINLLP